MPSNQKSRKSSLLLCWTKARHQQILKMQHAKALIINGTARTGRRFSRTRLALEHVNRGARWNVASSSHSLPNLGVCTKQRRTMLKIKTTAVMHCNTTGTETVIQIDLITLSHNTGIIDQLKHSSCYHLRLLAPFNIAPQVWHLERQEERYYEPTCFILRQVILESLLLQANSNLTVERGILDLDLPHTKLRLFYFSFTDDAVFHTYLNTWQLTLS